MLEIRLINENPDSLFYGDADVTWIWLTNKFGFSYKSKKIYGQHRLHFGWLVIWWGMFHLNGKERIK